MAQEKGMEEQSTGVVAWLAAPPLLRRDTVRLDALIDGMLILLEPFNPHTIRTDEPRIYRLNPLGRSLLRDALNAECVNLMMFEFGEHSIVVGRVIAYIGGDSLYDGGQWIPALPAVVEIDIATDDLAVQAEMAQRAADFVRHQAAALDAAAALVAQRGAGKHPGRSEYESVHGLPRLAYWKDIARFTRGAFWATFLGPTQCERLGGQDYVVRTAPIWRAEPAGHGVWLQISPDFPENEPNIAPLLAFLAPILSWTKDDLATSGDIDRMYHVPPSFPMKWFKDVSDPMLKQSPIVPLRKLPTYKETDSQIVLNIYTDGPISAEQRTILDIALHTWKYDGHEDGFNGAFIAWLGFLSFSSTSVRCVVDIDYHDDSLRALQEYLSILVGVTVREIVIGIEEVG